VRGKPVDAVKYLKVEDMKIPASIQKRIYEHRCETLDGITWKILFDWIATHIKCARKDDRRSLYVAVENFVYREPSDV